MGWREQLFTEVDRLVCRGGYNSYQMDSNTCGKKMDTLVLIWDGVPFLMHCDTVRRPARINIIRVL